MTKFALFLRLEAKPGKEAAVADFLAGALPLANAESGTTAWLALKFGPSTFGVFDAFADEAGRQAHLNGPIAAALMANAAVLFSARRTSRRSICWRRSCLADGPKLGAALAPPSVLTGLP